MLGSRSDSRTTEFNFLRFFVMVGKILKLVLSTKNLEQVDITRLWSEIVFWNIFWIFSTKKKLYSRRFLHFFLLSRKFVVTIQ